MNWLIWKEYRLHRPILVFGAVLILLPFVVPLATHAFTRHTTTTTLAYLYGGRQIIQLCFGSVLMGYFTIALVGGHSIAGERTERAAEFFAYLPVPRWRSLISKLAIPFLTMVVIYGLNMGVVLCVAGVSGSVGFLTGELADEGLSLVYISLAALAAFSVGWMLSSFLESATFAVGGAILAPFLSIAIVSSIAYWFDIEMGDNDLMLMCTVMWLAITGICFPVGTWYFLHRVRP